MSHDFLLSRCGLDDVNIRSVVLSTKKCLYLTKQPMHNYSRIYNFPHNGDIYSI